MDALTLGLAALVVALVFKEKIKAALALLQSKLTRPNQLDHGQKWHDSLYNQVVRSAAVQAAELNHIKGQLQETLQEIKKPAPLERDPLLASIDGDVKALFQRVNLIAEAIKEAKESPKEDATQLYLQSLSSLAKGSQTVLDRQEAIELHLIEITKVLKSLT